MADSEVKTPAASSATKGTKLTKKELKVKRRIKEKSRIIAYRKSKKARDAAKKAEDKKSGVKKHPKLHNYVLPNGVRRYGPNKKTVVKPLPRPTAGKRKAPRIFIKKILGGEKNGGSRLVRLRKLPNYYSLNRKSQIRKKGYRLKDVRKLPKLRKSIQPGTICILLTGKHRGKRVVFLKQLDVTGLLLVTGPYFMNGVPLRRISQKFVIATKTRIDISKIKIPDQVKDHFFRRQKKKVPKVKKSEAAGDIFEAKKKQKYVPTEARKKAQIEVDKQVCKVIAARPDKRLMFGYLKTKFALSHGTYPHRLVF